MKPAEAVHLGLAGLWVALLVPTLVWWADSVLWVAVMSVYACVFGSITAWAALRSGRRDREMLQQILKRLDAIEAGMVR